VALAALAFALALVTRADADLWGHLRFGLDLLDTKRLTSIDPYSFTQDKPWTNHEWLSELQMAWAYRAGGVTGLLVLKAALVWVVFAIAWRSLRAAAWSVRIGAMLILVMGTIHMTSSVRPQLWTFASFAGLCLALPSARPAARWWLPALFIIWVNCHGGWIVGLGVLGVWAAAQVWQAPRHWRHWTGVTAASVAATLVNPYGIELWTFIATTVRMVRPIDEWQSLWSTPVLNWLPWAVSVVGIVWMWRRRATDRLPIGAALVMLAYAAARVMRIESLFVTAAVLLLAPTLRARWPRRTGVLSRRATRALAIGLLVAAVPSSITTGRRALSCVPIVATWAPDLEAMASLKHAGGGRIVTPFNWGQYAIWHLAPRLRVSMDGRRETVYSDARLAEHEGILTGTPEGLAALAEWQVEYAWLPAGNRATAAWLTGHGYRVDVDTGRSLVVVRGDLPRLPAAGAPGTVRTCFPG
jgi:hypothetical protein